MNIRVLTRVNTRVLTRALATAVAALLAGGCAVGPNYHRPSAPQSATFKELDGWKPTEPRDGVDRGQWWSIFVDDELDTLEREVAISNQNVKLYASEYQQALAQVSEAQAQLFPDLSLSPGVTRGGGGGGNVSAESTTGSAAGGKASTLIKLEATASWTPDIWGSIRRQIESNKAAAQVSAADLANAKLSAQATLAMDYFNLRAEDSLNDLLTDAVAGYQRTLDITKVQYTAGMAARSDVMTAEAQLQATKTQLIAVRQARGTYEHAIAMLTGHPPADLTIPPAKLTSHVPVVPAGVPSALLERNPQVAAAERQMQSENALIGVAEAAFFPQLTLSGLFGYAGNPVSTLINLNNRVWSGGASASQLLFDGGLHSAALKVARENYNQAVATYRQTVLTTFQSVEDQLLALHVLQDEQASADLAVADAKQAFDVALAEYKAGTVAYTSVVTAEEAYISDEQTALSVQQNRLVASVTLIEDLGGGWNQSELKL
jgi:NodT family efflux transporter outer membrane factor (OMF) lipoprotein